MRSTLSFSRLRQKPSNSFRTRDERPCGAFATLFGCAGLRGSSALLVSGNPVRASLRTLSRPRSGWLPAQRDEPFFAGRDWRAQWRIQSRQIRHSISGAIQPHRGLSAHGALMGRTRITVSITSSGSGTHASCYLARVGDHLFESPICMYPDRGFGMAPGYEENPAPGFTRPVTIECLLCHSGRPLPIPGTLNGYRTPAFSEEAISCDRCHGDSAAHLKRPVPGSIVNPAKLRPAERDSICEQCHLAGAIRVLNPGKRSHRFSSRSVAGERLHDLRGCSAGRRHHAASCDQPIGTVGAKPVLDRQPGPAVVQHMPRSARSAEGYGSLLPRTVPELSSAGAPGPAPCAHY